MLEITGVFGSSQSPCVNIVGVFWYVCAERFDAVYQARYQQVEKRCKESKEQNKCYKYAKNYGQPLAISKGFALLKKPGKEVGRAVEQKSDYEAYCYGAEYPFDEAKSSADAFPCEADIVYYRHYCIQNSGADDNGLALF